MDKKGYGCAVRTGFMLSPETFHVSQFTLATHLKIRICRQMTYLYRLEQLGGVYGCIGMHVKVVLPEDKL